MNAPFKGFSTSLAYMFPIRTHGEVLGFVGLAGGSKEMNGKSVETAMTAARVIGRCLEE